MTSAPPPPVVTKPRAKYAVQSGPQPGAERVVVYGPPGVGKSSLAALAPDPIFLDPRGSSRHLSVKRITGVETFSDYLGALRDQSMLDHRSIILDDFACVLDLADKHIVATIKTDKGGKAERLDDYGYGKGNIYLYDHVNLVLGALDSLRDNGVNVIINLHQSPIEVPNPAGEDYQQFQPAILGKDEKSRTNIRGNLVGWADYVLYIGFDRAVNEDGKAKVGGSRTIYTQERGGFLAKSRTKIPATIAYKDENDATVWQHIGLK